MRNWFLLAPDTPTCREILEFVHPGLLEFGNRCSSKEFGKGNLIKVNLPESLAAFPGHHYRYWVSALMETGETHFLLVDNYGKTVFKVDQDGIHVFGNWQRLDTVNDDGTSNDPGDNYAVIHGEVFVSTPFTDLEQS